MNQYLFTTLTAIVLAIPLLPATASEEVIAPPAAPTFAERRAATDQKYEQFLTDILNSDWSSIVKPEHDLDAVKYDQVAGSQAGMGDIDAANEATQTMLMMEGKAVQSSIEDAYNMGEFQPTLYGGDSMPVVNDLVQTGRNVRAGLGESLVQEQQRIIEKSFQPKRVKDAVHKEN